MKLISSCIVISVIALSCESNQNSSITNIADYEQYLVRHTDSSAVQLEKEVVFWQEKIKQTPSGFTFYQKLGSTYSYLFEATGKVENLHSSFDAFERSVVLTHGRQRAASLLTLSNLAVKKHDFGMAARLAAEAGASTDKKIGPLLMQYDAEMELGNYQTAGAILMKHKQMRSFDYLVRLSKYKDHQGNLDSAIAYMEQAEILVGKEDSDRKIWAKANLGDMYGHAGRIQDSYSKYLEVLSLEPNYSYALKGIAWIAYSADKNTDDALRILKSLKSRTAMPDLLLDMAEIHEFNGDAKLANQLKNQFIDEASRPKYQNMYNKYLIELYLEQGRNEEAMKLAEKEIKNRQTPTTYDWLAQVYLAVGELDKAIELYEENVEGRTHEPEVTYHMGMAYKMARLKKGTKYLRQSLEAAYELGPLSAKTIESNI